MKGPHNIIRLIRKSLEKDLSDNSNVMNAARLQIRALDAHTAPLDEASS